MLIKTGVPTAEDISAVTPSQQRLAKGPVAMIECFQKIPCNPCYLSCRQGAIQEFADINDLPRIDESKCNGCGICVANCPGLAIFVVDYTYSDDEGLVKIPYEYLPVPGVDSEVTALDREGKAVGAARVVKVQRIKGQERTPVIWLAVPKELVMSVRNIRVGG
ncbi:4Fe-4S binding protein [Desulfoscipio sp. XC116]|uniref:4Fe-4S binding protein n=1 Tax=Desulfoscipio sp. XC116 TaxID=3144975 RepID=UPI00325A5342